VLNKLQKEWKSPYRSSYKKIGGVKMGLDISSEYFTPDIEELINNVDSYLLDEVLAEVQSLVNKDKSDEAFDLINKEESYISKKERDYAQYNIDFYLKLKELSKIDDGPSSNDLVLVENYDWIYENEELSDSRMGTYGMIHYGRSFVSFMDKYCDEKGIDITKLVATEEMVKELMVRQVNSSNSYTTSRFDNICNHSDCDGYYIPTQERVSFEYGSSILLLKELDIIFKSGIVTILDSMVSNIKEEHPDIYYSNLISKEQSTLYNMSNNISWVLKKLLYHALESIQEDMMIIFC
jgi:hypothetical protein